MSRVWEVGKIVSGVLFHSLLSRERDSLILQRVKNVAAAAGEKERGEEVRCLLCGIPWEHGREKA